MKINYPLYTRFECFGCKKDSIIIIGNQVRFNKTFDFQCPQCGKRHLYTAKTEITKDDVFYVELSDEVQD